MIDNQGEVAVVVDIDEEGKPSLNFSGYALPHKPKFELKELKNVFLSASLSSGEFEENKSFSLSVSGSP